jgi:hypothetical protein
MTAVGCVLVYASVILLGLDHSTLPSTDKAFPTICSVGTINTESYINSDTKARITFFPFVNFHIIVSAFLLVAKNINNLISQLRTCSSTLNLL